jgi:hypothetical protein
VKHLTCEIDTFRRHHQTVDESGSDEYYGIWLHVEGMERPIMLRAPMHWYPHKEAADGRGFVDDDATMLTVLRELQKRVNGK